MLVDANERKVAVKLFGKWYPSPLLLAPIGVQGILHRKCRPFVWQTGLTKSCAADGEEGSARAAAEVGVPYIMSTAATRSIEQVAAASGDGDRWFQLYWPADDDVTTSVLNRAKKSGFSVLVVTLDTVTIGFRPKDLDKSYLPFLKGIGCQVGFSDPAFLKSIDKEKYLGKPLKDIPEDDLSEMSVQNLGMFNSGIYKTWQDLEVIKKLWDGPIVLKGIQTLYDAHKAIEYGMDGIVISSN